jgi:hypothetical protein
MTERTRVRLLKGAKRKAAAEKQRFGIRKRTYPRVSSATGGLMPGIDLGAHSAAQELDDLDYAEQMKNFK